MDAQKIFSQPYFNLKRFKDEGEFIQTLNELEVQELIVPSLQVIADRLFSRFNSNPPVVVELKEFPNENLINSKLKEGLTGNRLFTKIEDVNITDKLFTNAFIKLTKRIFEKEGRNDEVYDIQSYVHYWLEESLAKFITKDKRFSSYIYIMKLLDQTEMLYNFSNSFEEKMPLHWIYKDVESWTSTQTEFSNILDHIRTFDKDYFTGYENQLNKLQNLSPWKFVVEATQFSDYGMLNLEYSFKNRVLFQKDIDLWIKFWDNLKFPILQDIAISYMNVPSDFLSIAEALNKMKENITSSPKHLALILLNNLFECMSKVQDNLSLYINTEKTQSISVYEKDEDLLIQGKTAYEKWLAEIPIFYNAIFTNVSSILNFDEISEWVFSYKPREISLRNEDSKLYNDQIASLVKSYSAFYSALSIDEKIKSLSKKFSFQNFNAIVEQIDIGSHQAKDLLYKLTEFINSTDFYWDRTFSEMYLATIKGIGVLVSYCEDPQDIAIELLNNVKVYLEGWKLSNNDFELVQRESFVLCGIMMVLEHKKCFKGQNQKKLFFNVILDYTISQMRFANQIENDYYFLPLYLLGLITNRIYPPFKNRFESELIDSVDDLVIVLKVLSSNEYQISKKGQTKLTKRIDNELYFIKQILIQKNQTKEVEEIELMVSRVKETIS